MSENINNIINENTSQETSIRFENITKRFGDSKKRSTFVLTNVGFPTLINLTNLTRGVIRCETQTPFFVPNWSVIR